MDYGRRTTNTTTHRDTPLSRTPEPMFFKYLPEVTVRPNAKSLKNSIDWSDNISNPKNAEFVNEVAFNNGIKINEVTQKMFSDRYIK
jgi:hypothetical protein